MVDNSLYSDFLKNKLIFHTIVIFAILLLFLLLFCLFRKDKNMIVFFVCLCLFVVLVWIWFAAPFIMDSIDKTSYIVYEGEYNIKEIVYTKTEIHAVIELSDKTNIELNISEYSYDFHMGYYKGTLEYSKYSKYLFKHTTSDTGDG